MQHPILFMRDDFNYEHRILSLLSAIAMSLFRYLTFYMSDINDSFGAEKLLLSTPCLISWLCKYDNALVKPLRRYL